MKKKISILIVVSVISLLPLLSGCASTGAVTRAMAKDGAIVKVEVGTPWGVQKFIRIGGPSLQGGTVSIAPDGTITVLAARATDATTSVGPPSALPITHSPPRVIFIPVTSPVGPPKPPGGVDATAPTTEGKGER